MLKAEVEELKHRLSIKMRQQDALEARLRVARVVVQANRARAREARMTALRHQRGGAADGWDANLRRAPWSSEGSHYAGH